jgi:hypothetical protein
MSLQPIIIIFSIFGLILHFWASKYSLFNRCRRPVPGTKILYDTTIQFVYVGGLFYALGSLSFINLLPNDLFNKKIGFAFVANLIAIGFGGLTILIPFSWIYSLFCKNDN